MSASWWIVTVWIWACSLIGSHVWRASALRSPELFDKPNARSSHVTPTPRGGGAALVAALLIASLVWGANNGLSWPLAAFIVGFLGVAWIGWRDDVQGVRASLRLAVHFACIGLFLLALRPPLHTGWAFVDNASPWIIATVLWVGSVWLLNLYNFMDGIDAIAAVQGITSALTFAYAAWTRADTQTASLSMWLGVACLGFLPLNWSPAKLFLGDVGSGFLGFCFAALSLWGAQRNIWNLSFPLIVLAPFICDATWTLLRRLVGGESLVQAHRQHAYQKAARHWNSHRKVSAALGFHNLLWLAPLAVQSQLRPAWQGLCLALAYAPSLYACWHFRAGARESA